VILFNINSTYCHYKIELNPFSWLRYRFIESIVDKTLHSTVRHTTNLNFTAEPPTKPRKSPPTRYLGVCRIGLFTGVDRFYPARCDKINPSKNTFGNIQIIFIQYICPY
jgi:hypothetical protein